MSILLWLRLLKARRELSKALTACAKVHHQSVLCHKEAEWLAEAEVRLRGLRSIITDLLK